MAGARHCRPSPNGRRSSWPSGWPAGCRAAWPNLSSKGCAELPRQDIDGSAAVALTVDLLHRHFGLSVGHALAVQKAVEELLGTFFFFFLALLRLLILLIRGRPSRPDQ